MFKVTIEYPYIKGLGQKPDDSEVCDTQEEAEAYVAKVREYGGIADWYEMSDSQCYHHNMNVHSHGW
jgi:hypothetical protein